MAKLKNEEIKDLVVDLCVKVVKSLDPTKMKGVNVKLRASNQLQNIWKETNRNKRFEEAMDYKDQIRQDRVETKRRR